MRSSVLLVLVAADAAGTKREREAVAAGPEAVKAALAGELAKAHAAGDVEHAKSIEDHTQDYLNDVHESLTHERQRQAAADGPEAVKEALEGEYAEREIGGVSERG